MMRLLGHTTFDSGKAEIRDDMIQTLQAIGKIVGGTAYDVFVAGHTDNVPTRGGTYRSNLDLSVARAAAVVTPGSVLRRTPSVPKLGSSLPFER